MERNAPDESRLVAVRLFLVDSANGRPAPGITVSLVMEWWQDHPGSEVPVAAKAVAPTDTEIGVVELRRGRRVLATLQTDAWGYVSFKIDRAPLASPDVSLSAAYGSSTNETMPLNISEIFHGSDVYTIRIDASSLVPGQAGLPSVMLPDIRDCELSPASIGLLPQLHPSGGLCNQLMPTRMGVRRFRAVQVAARDICSPSLVLCDDDRIEYERAELLEYEVAWHPAGTSLGDLLNTVTLAPCEQIQVAISDWMREERSQLEEVTEVRQRTTELTNHDRLIVETMNGSLDNSASAWGISGSAGRHQTEKGSLTLKDLVSLSSATDITAAIAAGYSSSTSTTQMALSTSNQLSERIARSATSVQSKRSTVVFQVVASERQTYQTRTVRNHNHCHTLTFMYYQVNASYKVITEFKGRRDVILIRTPLRDFDAVRAYENMAVLQAVLLEPSLASAFDELADALFCCNLAPPDEESPMLESMSVTFWVQETKGSLWWMNGFLMTGPDSIGFGNSNMQPHLSTWAPGGMYTIPVPLSSPIEVEQAVSIVLTLVADPTKPDSSMTFSKIEVRGQFATGATKLLFASQGDTVIDIKDNPKIVAWLSAEVSKPSTDINACIEKSCNLKKLLGHLNAHKSYYHTALLYHMDPNERVRRWSCCRAGEERFNLIGRIENTPVTVYGDYVVFPAAKSPLVDDPLVPPSATLVMLPTPGVYSEGILGRCNTCEVTDDSRFWDWSQSPCADAAPASIGAPEPPQSGTKPQDLRGEAITNLINLSALSEPPGGLLKDLISTLLAKADAGSTEAKDLLNKLLETVKASIPAAPS